MMFDWDSEYSRALVSLIDLNDLLQLCRSQGCCMWKCALCCAEVLFFRAWGHWGDMRHAVWNGFLVLAKPGTCWGVMGLGHCGTCLPLQCSAGDVPRSPLCVRNHVGFFTMRSSTWYNLEFQGLNCSNQ